METNTMTNISHNPSPIEQEVRDVSQYPLLESQQSPKDFSEHVVIDGLKVSAYTGEVIGVHVPEETPEVDNATIDNLVDKLFHSFSRYKATLQAGASAVSHHKETVTRLEQEALEALNQLPEYVEAKTIVAKATDYSSRIEQKMNWLKESNKRWIEDYVSRHAKGNSKFVDSPLGLGRFSTRKGSTSTKIEDIGKLVEILLAQEDESFKGMVKTSVNLTDAAKAKKSLPLELPDTIVKFVEGDTTVSYE